MSMNGINIMFIKYINFNFLLEFKKFLKNIN